MDISSYDAPYTFCNLLAIFSYMPTKDVVEHSESFTPHIIPQKETERLIALITDFFQSLITKLPHRGKDLPPADIVKSLVREEATKNREAGIKNPVKSAIDSVAKRYEVAYRTVEVIYYRKKPIA